jgi:hypothetical protein
MRRLLAMFVLTPREQRLVIFAVLALVVGASIKHHRDIVLNDGLKRGAAPSLTPLASPTPGQR